MAHRVCGRKKPLWPNGHKGSAKPAPKSRDVAGKLFKEKGMEYRRKLTPRERAAQEVRRLIKEHNLRSEFPGYDAAASEAEPPEGTKVG